MTVVSWGKYGHYEGPFYKGTQKFNMPLGPSVGEEYKRLAVITATEGGHFDAVNMYDRCIVSVGLIQWCEAGMFGVSDMLGALAARYPKILDPIRAICSATGYDFKQQVGGKWRFCTTKGEVVDTLREQQHLFLLHSDGTLGSWDDQSKEHAKRWAVAFSEVFQDPVAQKLQVQYTVGRLHNFMMPDAKAIMNVNPVPGTPEQWVNAARAAFLSFSANLPAVAAKHLKKFVEQTTYPAFTPNWVQGMIKQLTFGPEIAIYPARYNAIRPVLEKLYGIDLPDFADELKGWCAKENIDVDDWNASANLTTVIGIQQALLLLGYDLGPKRADNIYGPKTANAIMLFQKQHNLGVDGIVGPRTRAVLLSELHDKRLYLPCVALC